jgi:hypothetical protein
MHAGQARQPLQPLPQQQESPCRHGHDTLAAARRTSAASDTRRATVSKTLADMQHQYGQEQRKQQALLSQQQHIQVQPWLQDKQLCVGGSGTLSRSPGSWQASTGHFAQDRQQLACLQPPAVHQGVSSSTAIRVSTAGCQAVSSPPNMRMPVDGGCVDMCADGVEVRSTNRLVISVCSSPTLG